MKKVKQYDLNGKFIKEFDSIKEAAKNINRNKSGLADAVNGVQKTCGGFIWKYSRRGR